MTRTASASSTVETVTAVRSGLYLIALSSSFAMACVIRLLSAATGGMRPWPCSIKRMRFFLATGCIAAMVSRTASSKRSAILMTSCLSPRSSCVTERNVSIMRDIR